jgi:signal transduction histidine kinase
MARNINALRIVKIVLTLSIVIFASAATYTSIVIVKRQNALRETSRYNVVWAASQALAEFHRFEYRVAASAMPASLVQKEELRLRFDILYNRLNILKGGDVAAFTDGLPEQGRTVEQLGALLGQLDPLMDQLDDPSSAGKILTLLTPLEVPLIQFAAAANQFGGNQVADDHETLIHLHWLLSSLATALFLCGVLFIGLLLVQNKLIGKAHRALGIANRDLRAAKEVAEAASAAKSRFLANMSHELRTPLNAIIGFSEMIAREVLGPVAPQKYAEYAMDVWGSGKHMLALVNDILTMAKLDAGGYEITPETLRLGPLINSIVTVFQGTEMARGRSVAISARDWPDLYADERAIRQMLLNLLSNAVKFSASAASVVVTCHRLEGTFSIDVIDEGIGMTQAEAELVVKPFHQVDSSLSRRYDGTGLGLSIVASLMKNHNGRLAIKSEPNRGSTMSLVFPASACRPADRAADPVRLAG